MNKDATICTYQIGKPTPKYEAPIINYRVAYYDDNVNIIMSKTDYETLNKYAYMGQTQQDKIDGLNNIIDELEKYLKEQQEHYRYVKDNRYRRFLCKNLDKLNELKGDNK